MLSDPSLVVWSSAADPGEVPTTWTPAADNDAGSAVIADVPGKLVTGERLGEGLVLYKERSATLMEFVGGNDVFGFRPLYSNISILGEGGVVDIGNRHALLTTNDVMLHDGSSPPISVLAGKVRSTIFNRLNKTTTRGQNSFLFFNYINNELWVCINEDTDDINGCTFIAVLDLDSGDWTFREPINPIHDLVIGPIVSVSGLPLHLAHVLNIVAGELSFGVTPTPHLRALDTDDEVSVEASMERLDLDFGDAQRIKYVRSIHVLYEGTEDLEVRVGSRMDLEDEVTWADWTSVVRQQVYVDTMGRFISVGVRATTVDIWRVAGVEFEYEMRGYH
jgi:hypothetical protein